MIKPPKRIVRISYLIQATGSSRGAYHRELENNPEFPRKIKLGTRAIGFDINEVDAFIERIIQRGSL